MKAENFLNFLFLSLSYDRVRTVKEDRGGGGNFEESQGNSANFSMVWKDVCFPDLIREFLNSLEPLWVLSKCLPPTIVCT